jgi:hypothetical protein
MPSTTGWFGIGAPASSISLTSSVPVASDGSGSALPAVAPRVNSRPPAGAAPACASPSAPPPGSARSPAMSIVRIPPLGGMVNASVASS